ncbi:acyltransferase family protein [Achromobacter aloeverae]|uniref:Acyltransferase 3 domain-containing protein n=1 Tax=Achromobacter aloeverae TaxID=1750518 RepID=A0A4Q1HSK5_9BURK|nr:acyltransferase [Achromobacter aloeverae]RXN93286.1 hypothetical protein C7R54_06195 [Achromobacter aloeverae]
MSPTPNNIPVLNGLRALAVIIVFMTHASNSYFGGLFGGAGAGQTGVMLFFVLSGLLMGHLYLNVPATRTALLDFAVKRIARIYPLFFCVVMVCYGLARSGWILDDYRLGMELLPTLAFVKGASILWTIGPEVIFYAVFLLLWPLWQARRGVFWAALLAMLTLSLLPLDLPLSNSLFALHYRLPYFLAGMFIGLDLSRASALFGKSFHWMLAVFILAAPQVLGHFIALPEVFYSGTWGLPLYLALTVAFVLSCLAARPWLLTNPFTEYLGKISFSFYLIHMVVLKNFTWLPSVAAVTASFLVTVILSHATYRWIELPSRNLGRRILRKARETSEPIATISLSETAR